MKQDNHVFQYSTGALLFVCLFVSGCSQYVKVSGTVTYSDTGEAVKSGAVVFTGEKEIAQGIIKDGKYSVGRVKDGDGVLPGTYTIDSESLPIPEYYTFGAVGMDGMSLQTSTQQDREIYYTKEPETIDVKKSMTYDLKVERGARPL